MIFISLFQICSKLYRKFRISLRNQFSFRSYGEEEFPPRVKNSVPECNGSGARPIFLALCHGVQAEELVLGLTERSRARRRSAPGFPVKRTRSYATFKSCFA